MLPKRLVLVVCALLCSSAFAEAKPHLLAAAPVGYATPFWFAAAPAAAAAAPITAAYYPTYPAYAAYTPVYGAYATYPYYFRR